MKIWIICHHSPSLPLQMNFLMLYQSRKPSYDNTRMMRMAFGGIGWLDLLMGSLDLLKDHPSDPKRHDWALDILQTESTELPCREINDHKIAEHCPLAAAYASKMAHHLKAYGGACLIIDYGRDGQSGDSLQAVANHQPVDVFYQPGSADLSHWVDFSAIRRAVEEAGARLIGPITQGEFLLNIGIIQRSEALAKLADVETRRGFLQRLTGCKQSANGISI